ncbi:MAG: hypothetical protein ACOC2N_07290 [Spirochaetota bacterium]
MARPMFSVETDSRAYMQAMRWLARDAIPAAVAETLNTVARAAHNAAERNIRKEFTLRNAFTLRGHRFSESRPKAQIGAMYAQTGHQAEYMAEQEEGFTRKARRRRIPIPTTAARTSRSRSRPVAPRYRMNRLGRMGGQYFIGRPGGNRNKKIGIYQRMRGGRLRMIRDLSVRRYTVRRTNWHTEAVNKFATRRHMAAAWQRAAQRRLRRVEPR